MRAREALAKYVDRAYPKIWVVKHTGKDYAEVNRAMKTIKAKYVKVWFSKADHIDPKDIMKLFGALGYEIIKRPGSTCLVPKKNIKPKDFMKCELNRRD